MDGKLKIMLVDDDQGCLEALTDALNISGFVVEPFSDPAGAVTAYAPDRYDLVITDINMPGVSGLELLAAVREINPSAYVIILTGFADIENAILATNQGAYSYFRKPLDIMQLLETLEKIQHEQNRSKETSEKVNRYDELETDLSFTYQELQHYVVLLDQLQWIGRKIHGAGSLHGILKELIGSAAHLIGADLSLIAFQDGRDGLCSVYSREEYRTVDLFEGELPDSEPFHGWLRDKRGNLDNSPGDDLKKEFQGIGIELKNLLRAPLASGEKTMGALVVINKNGGFSATDKFLVDSLAHSAVTAITNSKQIADLKDLFGKTVALLSNAIETRDVYTGGHTNRVTAYSMALGNHLGLDETALQNLYIGTLLHDIGKIGIPDAVLNKPGRLTAEEYSLMKNHVMIGVSLLKDVPQLSGALPALRSHHERFDGGGYPDRLAGPDIPLEGRIVAVADSFDAMTSTRAYRQALSPEVAITELKKCSGAQFDPVVVESFVRLNEGGAFKDLIPQMLQDCGSC